MAKQLTASIYLAIACFAIFTTDALAGDLRKKFEDKIAQVERGIGGYTGPVEPITEPIELRYTPHDVIKMRIETLNQFTNQNDEQSFFELIQDYDISVSRSQSGNLKSYQTYQSYELETEPKKDSPNSELFPIGSTFTIEFDGSGKLLDAELLPPPGGELFYAPPGAGTPEFEIFFDSEKAKQFIAASALTGDPVFKNIVLSNEYIDGITNFGGFPPTLRGRTKCENKNCLVIEINEERGAPLNNGKVYVKANGYMLLELPSLRVFESLMRSRGIIGTQGSIILDFVVSTRTLN